MAQAKRKKRFFDVEIPIIKNEMKLFAYEIGELEGRFASYDLTRMLKGKGTLLTLKVSVQDGKATAKPVSIRIMPYFLKRIVRKGTNYVEDSFSAETKDSIIKIKPFLVTRRKVPREVRKALRIKAKEEIINYVKDKNIDKVIEDITLNKMQKEISLKLKKVYPLSACEIRVLKIEKALGKKNEKKDKKSA